jgi:hypothetical protein
MEYTYILATEFILELSDEEIDGNDDWLISKYNKLKSSEYIQKFILKNKISTF